MSFFWWVKSFPPHLGFHLGFLCVLTDACVGGAKWSQPTGAGRSTTSPTPSFHSCNCSCGSASYTLDTSWCCARVPCQCRGLESWIAQGHLLQSDASSLAAPWRDLVTTEAAPRPPERGTQLHFSTTLLTVCRCSIVGHLPVLGECYSLPRYLELISGEGLWFPGWPLLALEHTKLLISEF